MFFYKQSGGLIPVIRRLADSVKFLAGLSITGIISVVFCSAPTYAVATASSIDLDISPHGLSMDLTPGIFGKTSDVSIGVSTDNFTGYKLTVASATSSTDLVDAHNNTIQSVPTSVSESDFSSLSTYDNQFGIRPSQYISSGSVVQNSNYLQIPSTTGIVIDETSVANSTDNSYTLSFGAKVNSQQPAGTYTYQYVISAVGNAVVYNITYDGNGGGATVNGLPSPNPQPLTIDGGTSAEESYGTLSSNAPTRADRTFIGWCTTVPVLDTVTNNQECSGTTYQPGDSYPIDQTSDGSNITLYAIWIADPFPTVWSQMGKCVFDHGDISGSECLDYANDSYIDTKVALYSNANYQKDYEVHFTIDVYNPNSSVQTESQTTMFNDKLSSSVTDSPYGGKSPGIVVRTTSSNSFEIKSTYGAPTDHVETQNVTKTPYATAYNGTDVRIFRINGHIYTSVDNEPLVELQDYTSFNQQFGLTAWFGAYPDNVNCTENCTAAKRYFTGEMSNMYIKLGDFDESNLHEIIFDENYGSTPTTTTYLILDGDTVSPLPTATRTDWFFDGWWTTSSGGTQRTAPYTPTASEHLYAHWYKSVSEAQITNSSISLDVSDTETIQITNSADLEPYTFTSSDDTIATVSSAGVVTATGNGVATITMTGTKTGDTKTITVTVGNTITVTFDPDYGSEATFTESVASGGSFSSLPTYSRTGYELEGWYSQQGGAGTQLTTSTVFGSNTPTTYYANWEQIAYVCKIATTRHFETCTQASGYGCRKAGWGTDARIDYGYLIQDSSTVTAGAAYDCDVDYDGIYDDETERFYYFGTENGNAKLIHYINQQNNASVAYDVAASYLPNYELDTQNPTIPVWDNPNLVTYNSGTFAGKAARFMTYEEMYDLWTGGSGKVKPSDYTSVFLFENTNFATTGRTDGVWLQLSANNGKNRIQTSSLTLTHNGNTSANASRATILVPTEYMEPYTAPAANYTITFNPHNETATWTETITAGNTLGNVYPATDPTYTNHIFKGWYTAQSGGSAITSSTQPSGDTTYHAQWRSVVDVVVFDNDHLTVEEGSTVTIAMVNPPSDLEDHTFTSNNTAIATVDANGVITGVEAGSTTITMAGADSTHTRTIYVEVTVPTPTTYTIYFNPHNGESSSSATVTIGSTIGNNNIPADPTNSDPDMVFMGWFTAASGGTAVDGNTTPSADGETYHAQWKKIVCKLATAGTLHTATKTSNSANTEPEYGQIADDPIPQAGDAYNCDVDYDDTYSAVNERFYYVGQDTNNNAVLVAWNSYYNGAWAAGTSSDSIFSYDDALGQLPANTSGAWDNPGLIEQETGKAARFTTRAEVIHACGDITVTTVGALDFCDYFMEHSGYDGGGRSALWLMKESNTQYRIHGGSSNRQVGTSTGTSMVRPTIVVPYKLIEKFTPVLLDVTNAVIANNDLTVPVGGNITIQVSNSAELEPYTFSSDNASIATVDSSTGVVTGVSTGTVDIIMTGTNSSLTKTLEVEVVSSAQDFTVTFNANGGILDDNASSTRTVADGNAVGALPTASKTNYKFFGWYTDNGTFYEEVYPEEVVDADVTYYAKWEEDISSFPIVWSEINECTFTGTTVTGTYCGHTNSNSYYIDTNIQLFIAANYNKDYEIGFTITEYDPASQLSGGGNQATFVSTKKEDSGNQYPGFVVRRYSGTNYIEITSRWKGDAQSLALSNFPATTKTVKLQKRKETEQGNDYYRIYYSVDGGAWTLYEDITNKTHFEFNTKVWFGGAEAANGTSPMRPLKGKMTDMYVKLGVDSEYLVELNANGGSLPSGTQSSYTITAGSPVGALPTPIAPSANYVFGGWYDGNTLVSDGTQFIPTSNVTLVADWVYNSSDTPVTFDVSNNATRGYKTIINNWVQSPTNITTFNENATINNSTWGDTSVLTETQFWTALKNNFETNNCMKPSYGDAATTTPNPTAWANGSVDCAKPDEYDTLLGEAVNVYLYNNQTLGAQVTYANSSDGVIRNLIPGNTYKWVKDGDSTVYGYVTVTSNGSDHGTRWVDTGQIRNVRDLGGLPADTDDDGTVDAYVHYGRLFRGEKLWTAPATNLTNLGITKEYDVGDPAEYSGNTRLSSYKNDQVIHYNFDYNSGDENNANSNYMKAWTAVTDIMTDITNSNNPQNIYFHCRVGADRTGTVAYLLEGLLGVPDEERYQEYSLTHLSGLFDRTRYYKQKSSSNNLKFVFMMGYVKTTQDIIDWYMHNPSADSDLIDDFRAAMTTPIQSQQQQSLSPAPENNNNIEPQQLNNMSANNAGYLNSVDTNNSGSNEFDDSYSEPLGVSATSDGAKSGYTGTGASSVAGTIVAVTAVVTAGAAAYSLVKQEDEE